MKGKSKDIVLNEKAISDWLKNEGLRVCMRWITVGLMSQNLKEVKLSKSRSHVAHNRFTCNLPRTLIRTPPSNMGCESMAVMIRLIFWKVRL